VEEPVRFQHYVPKCYLKNFSNSKRKESYIWVFDKEKQKIFSKNIKEIAKEEEFYNRVDEEQFIERGLRDIETKFDEVVRKLILTKDIDELNHYEKKILSEFIAYQMIRTKETREEVRDTVRQIYDKLGSQMAPDFKRQVVEAMDEESLRDIHKRMLGKIGEFQEIMIKMKWVLVVNKFESSYWCSDNPVIEYNSLGKLGLTSLGIQVYFPINSELCLILCDPIYFKQLPKEIVGTSKGILFERELQTLYSTRFIFSKNSDFNIAKVTLENNPKYKDPNRKRVKIN